MRMYNHNIYIYIYSINIVCDQSCNGCSGPSNEKCLLCEINSSYYPLDTRSTTCILMCNSPGISLYLNTTSNTCKSCHINCAICFGSSEFECSQCLHPFYLGNNQECVYTDCANYPNTFPNNYICQECHPNCDGCIYTTNNCLACLSPYLKLPSSTSCSPSCPSKYYPYLTLQICQRDNIHIYIYIYLYIICIYI